MLTELLGQAILLESSLSFLGLGVSEPTPADALATHRIRDFESHRTQ
jgi:ABC-type dipeptide/oligopeptide/nickel transport system permease subunit